MYIQCATRLLLESLYPVGIRSTSPAGRSPQILSRKRSMSMTIPLAGGWRAWPLTGTVTSGANPVNGATVNFGARSTTTAANGTYTFNNVPAGTYPAITASASGKTSVTNSSVVVPGGSSSTQNFSLAAAATSSCPTD